MSSLIGRGVLALAGLGLAFSCSSPDRNYDHAGTAGSGGDTAAGGSGGRAAGGATSAASGAGGSSAGMSNGGEAGMTAAAGASGAAGATGDCQPEDTRPCSDDGALGPCGAGIETCTADATWGECSVKPAAKDGCDANNDDNCNGIVNEGCPCVAGNSRSCKDAGALGKCATGTQACTKDGVWGGCSIVPAAKDSCVSDNDDSCNGTPNEGCTCIQGATRTCAQAGLVGKCAAAGAIETCSAAGTWGACSVTPSAADTCVAGNNDNCTGAANEGCQCINGVTKRACGACNDGTQTCTDGKTNTYGACTGAVLQPTTYYRDADGDGFGSSATTVTCGPPPAGYTDQTGDCCDDGGDLAQAKTIFPGQTQYFSSAATICSVGWNYDCSAGGSIQTSPATVGASCSPAATYPSCAADTPTVVSSASCGKVIGACGCTPINQGQGGTSCMSVCNAGPTVTCH